MNKPILDACCGSRMFWFDKDNPNVVFMDKRDEVCVLSDGQTVIVHPNIVGDFTAMPFPDKSFKLVVFDPPHIVWAGRQATSISDTGNSTTGVRNCARESMNVSACLTITEYLSSSGLKAN